ncbi:MAG: hypothetical protein ABI459_06520 [Deltaproteobacteria bacterium]
MSASARQSHIASPRISAPNTPLAPLSRSKVFKQGVDAEDFKAWFMPRWAAWLQTNFRNPEAVAVAFDVRMRTAENWWNVANCPAGEAVGLAFIRFPDAVQWFLAEWQGTSRIAAE